MLLNSARIIFIGTCSPLRSIALKIICSLCLAGVRIPSLDSPVNYLFKITGTCHMLVGGSWAHSILSSISRVARYATISNRPRPSYYMVYPIDVVPLGKAIPTICHHIDRTIDILFPSEQYCMPVICTNTRGISLILLSQGDNIDRVYYITNEILQFVFTMNYHV